MTIILNDEIERFRVSIAPIPSKKGDIGGLFMFPLDESNPMYHQTNGHVELAVIISSYDPTWEHITVSLLHRYPRWDEMQFIKDSFWTQDTTIVQYHPKIAEYVNLAPYMLHLWGRSDIDIELPDLGKVYGATKQEQEEN